MASRASTTLPLFRNASVKRRTYIALGISSPLLLFSPGIQQNRKALEGENGETGALVISIQLITSVVNTEGTRVSFSCCICAAQVWIPSAVTVDPDTWLRLTSTSTTSTSLLPP